MTLSEFLLARIAEDEHLLDLQRDGQASAEEVGYWSWPMDDALRRHERECEAKRRIVELHKPLLRITTSGCAACLTPRDVYPSRSAWPCATLRILALPYADHPDYDEAWRP